MKEILKFSATWCSPCKMLTETIKRTEGLTIPIREVDIDENQDLAIEYKVRGVPTLVMIEDGIEVKRVVGSLNQTQLKEFAQ